MSLNPRSCELRDQHGGDEKTMLQLVFGQKDPKVREKHEAGTDSPRNRRRRKEGTQTECEAKQFVLEKEFSEWRKLNAGYEAFAQQSGKEQQKKPQDERSRRGSPCDSTVEAEDLK